MSETTEIFEHKELLSIIEENEITTIDLRIATKNNDEINWITISYPVKSLNLEKFFKNSDIQEFNPIIRGQKRSVATLNIQEAFIDLFLAHKTLVFLTHDKELYTLQEFQAKNATLYFEFELHTDTESNMFVLDVYRDVRGEIVAAMLDMGIKVVSHYQTYTLSHCIIVNFTGDLRTYIELKYKIRYIISMIANTYNIVLNTNKGVMKQLSFECELKEFSMLISQFSKN